MRASSSWPGQPDLCFLWEKAALSMGNFGNLLDHGGPFCAWLPPLTAPTPASGPPTPPAPSWHCGPPEPLCAESQAEWVAGSLPQLIMLYFGAAPFAHFFSSIPGHLEAGRGQ